jgi:hypothetical protein
MTEKPVRVYFLSDDPAALWEQGDTADDLGPDSPGSNRRMLKLDHYDDPVVIEDPYGRGLIRRLRDEPAKTTTEEWDRILDEMLDKKEDDGEDV